MRTAGQIRDKQQARRFADYLLTRGISVRLAPCAEGFTVWVYDEDHLPAVREELTRFLAAPTDARYDVAREADALRAKARPPPTPPRALEIGSDAPPRVPLMATPLALALIAFCLVVALYTGLEQPITPPLNDLMLASLQRAPDNNYTWDGLSQIQHGEVWRLITPSFIHFSALHLVGNCMWLADVGRQVEARRGTLTLAAMVLIIGVASNYAQYAVAGPDFGGMSGVVFGLFAYTAVMSRFMPSSGLAVSPPMLAFMGVWLILSASGLLGPKSDVAHFVGIVLGLATGGISVWWLSRRL